MNKRVKWKRRDRGGIGPTYSHANSSWLAFHLILGIGIAIQIRQAPADPVWLNFWKAIGGNSSGAWYWFVSWVYLNSEVMTMILTLLSNKARVEQATATAERHRLWDDWNRRLRLRQDFTGTGSSRAPARLGYASESSVWMDLIMSK